MKNIYETFDDEEHAALLKKKGSRTWHDFILTLLKGGVNDGKNKSK